MEQIVYRPYGSYRFLAWVFICLALILCLLSYYFILPALLLLIPAFFLFRASKVTIIIEESGIRLLQEKTSPDRYISWDHLKFYRLDNTQRGQDVILLSSSPLPPVLAKRYVSRHSLSFKLWFDGVLVIPLNSTQTSESVRKFICKTVTNQQQKAVVV